MLDLAELFDARCVRGVGDADSSEVKLEVWLESCSAAGCGATTISSSMISGAGLRFLGIVKGLKKSLIVLVCVLVSSFFSLGGIAAVH